MFFLTLENFFTDPLAEREKALQATYKEELHNGINYRGISLQKDDASKKRIENFFRESLAGESTIYYRRYLEDEENETYIHSDCQIGKYTGLVYLTTDELCEGGTAFWKHKKYGWDMQPTKDQLKAQNLPDTKEFWEEVYQDGFDEHKWELLCVAPMKFNRAIFFNSNRFHSRYPKKSFGKELSDSRLVKVFFLNDHPRFECRPFNADHDYWEICKFWSAHNFPPVPLSHLPTRGFVIWDKIKRTRVGACWLYASDSKFAWLEWLVLSPDLPMRDRPTTIEMLLNNASTIATSIGAETIFCSFRSRGLIRIAQNVGFRVGDEEMTNLTRKLCL